jgi:hypothetical protein
MKESSIGGLSITTCMVLDAAVCFSLPTWVFAATPAWPADDPPWFAAALLSGAFLAMLLCHVVPAYWGRHSSAAGSFNIGVDVLVALASSLALAALAFLFGDLIVNSLAGSSGLNATLAVGAAFASGVVTVAWQKDRSIRAAGILSLLIGACLTAHALMNQWSGFWTTNSFWTSEAGKDHPWMVARGLILASAPVSILAFQVGRHGNSGRTIWRVGLVGVFLPMVASVGSFALAMMAGYRLHWVPSLPRGVNWAFAGASDTSALRWIWGFAALTCLAPCLVLALGIRNQLGRFRWPWAAPCSALATAALVLVYPHIPDLPAYCPIRSTGIDELYLLWAICILSADTFWAVGLLYRRYVRT